LPAVAALRGIRQYARLRGMRHRVGTDSAALKLRVRRGFGKYSRDSVTPGDIFSPRSLVAAQLQDRAEVGQMVGGELTLVVGRVDYPELSGAGLWSHCGVRLLGSLVARPSTTGGGRAQAAGPVEASSISSSSDRPSQGTALTLA
jgi:hypothetical protein